MFKFHVTVFYVMGKALQNVQVSCYSFLCDGQGFVN